MIEMGLVMRNRGMLCLILVVKILMLMVRFSVSITLQPEDEDGSYTHDVEWSPGFNFTQWSIHQRFFVGDSIHFIFKDDNSTSRVMEVSNTSYASCNMTSDGGVGIVVYKLMEPRLYFFIDTAEGHCSNFGMRLALSVNNTSRITSYSSTNSTNTTTTTTSSDGFLDQIKEILVEPTDSTDTTKKNNNTTSKIGGWLAFLFLVSATVTFVCIQKHKRKLDITLPITIGK